MARKCTKSVGRARHRCKGKKGGKLKKCMRRAMCGGRRRRYKR